MEFLIPLTQLRFETTPGDQTWGIDGIRSYPRTDRHHITLFPRDRSENTYLGQEEKISGFFRSPPVQNLELVPTVTALQTLQRKDADLGLTVKWGVTPNVTLNATVNPDFSQVEADAVQLDVNTQFALFFPETRPFFLEGSDLFRTARLNLLHTRQVVQPDGALEGERQDRTPRVRPLLGARRDDDDHPAGQPALAHARARHRYDCHGRTLPRRCRRPLHHRRDGDRSPRRRLLQQRRRRRFALPPHVERQRLRHLAVATTQDEPGAGGVALPEQRSDTAIDLLYDHSVRSWNAYANYSNIGKDFRADVGFITQVDTRHGELGGG